MELFEVSVKDIKLAELQSMKVGYFLDLGKVSIRSL